MNERPAGEERTSLSGELWRWTLARDRVESSHYWLGVAWDILNRMPDADRGLGPEKAKDAIRTSEDRMHEAIRILRGPVPSPADGPAPTPTSSVDSPSETDEEREEAITLLASDVLAVADEYADVCAGAARSLYDPSAARGEYGEVVLMRGAARDALLTAIVSALRTSPSTRGPAEETERERLAVLADMRAWHSEEGAGRWRAIANETGQSNAVFYEREAADWRTIASILRAPSESGKEEPVPELSAVASNELGAWLDNDGDERADDAIVKITDAKGAPITHVTAGWWRRYLTATDGTRFGPCVVCGRNYAEHTYDELVICHPKDADRAALSTTKGE